jgi:large subunit ribosomal protein L29
MKASELRLKKVDELVNLELNLLKEKFNLLMQKNTGELSKPDRIKKIRRDIARLYTVLTENGKQV